MRIVEVQLYRLAIPFRLRVSHSLAERNEAEAVVLVLRDESGAYGYGEGTPRDYVTGETMEGCLRAAGELGRAILDQGAFGSFSEVVSFLGDRGDRPDFAPYPSAMCALEIACFDLWGKTVGMSIWGLFGQQPRGDLTYSAVLPMVSADTFDRLLELTAANAMRYVKLKVGEEADLDRIRRARQVLGKDVDIRVDANGAFDAEGALNFLRGAAPYRLGSIEQPVPKGDVAGMKAVSDGGGIPVIADESLCTLEDAGRLIGLRACGGFNVRLSKCGGFLRSIGIIDLAVRSGFFCQIGCHVGETAILSAAGRHLAAIRPCYRYIEGSLSRYVLAEDLSTEDVDFGPGGRAPFLSGPGLGIGIDHARLKRRGALIERLA